MSFLARHSEEMQVLCALVTLAATIGLVIVTSFYARTTRDLLISQEAAEIRQFEPLVLAHSVEWTPSGEVRFCLANVGRGVAMIEEQTVEAGAAEIITNREMLTMAPQSSTAVPQEFIVHSSSEQELVVTVAWRTVFGNKGKSEARYELVDGVTVQKGEEQL